VRVFEGNFKGTYMRPGNSWDLWSCKQKPGESLQDYIQRFSRQRTELPNITDSDVIMAFLSGTTCKELVRELGRNTPITANGLMDIITNFAAAKRQLVPSLAVIRTKGSIRSMIP
jgi:broad specificity phosphatase PhoE